MRSEHYRWLLYDWISDTHVVLIISMVEDKSGFYRISISLSWPGHSVSVECVYDRALKREEVCFQNYGLDYRIINEKIADEVLDKTQDYVKGCTFIRELYSWQEGDSNA